MKKILLLIVTIIVLLTTIGLFLSSKVEVRKSIVVKANAEKVYMQIANFKHWDKWSPWHQMDPQIQKTFNNVASGVGAAYSWKSNHDQLGNGSILITEAKEFSKLKMEMKFEDRLAYAQFNFKEMPQGTEITWVFESDMGFNPFYRILGKVMKYFIVKDYEKGLENLQKTLQN
jgi:hypothetical protein